MSEVENLTDTELLASEAEDVEVSDELLQELEGTAEGDDQHEQSAQSRVPRRLLDIDGDDPDEFLELSGIKPQRAVPDIEEPWMKYHDFTLVGSVEEVNRIVDACIAAGACSLDLETEGLDNRIEYLEDGTLETVDKIVGFCVSYDGHQGFYIPIRHRPTDGGPDLNVRPVEEVEAAISRLCHAAIPEGTDEAKAVDPLSYTCKAPRLVIYFWNAQFDHEFLYPITGIDWWHPASFEDGMLACFCIYAGDKKIGLKAKAKELLRDSDGLPYTMIELKSLFFGRRKDIRFALLAPDEPGVLRYAGSDAICTYLLCEKPELVPLCLKRHGNIYRIEKQVTNVVRIMERARVRINRTHVMQLLAEQEEHKAALLRKIRAFSMETRSIELDPNSPKQLSAFLFGPKPDGLDITPKPERNAASGQYKTDGDTLVRLAEEPNAPAILKDIVRYREIEKFIGTYLVGLAHNPDENDEIRVSFKQTGAASGRFSAPAGSPEHGYSGIPIHGIPGKSDIRRDFIARDGYTMVKADYAGEELRIAANVTGEKVWVDEFLNGTGDLHSITARAFFKKHDITKEERSAGKSANFSLLYGGGPKAIVRATKCTESEARLRKEAFDKAVPVFSGWIKRQHRKVKQQLGVTTAFGRWLALPDANHEDRAIQAAVERHAVNYQIQGAGADIMKICLVLLAKKFHKMGWLAGGRDAPVRMLLTVHDEVVFEVRHDLVATAIPIIVDIMESPWRMPNHPRWKVPLVVEPLLGFNWKSGFSAERARTDRQVTAGEVDRYQDEIPLRKHEVLMNGFVYSTTREPKRDKKTRQIVESLDRQEVLDGDVFRIENAPWLVGACPSGTEPTGQVPPPHVTGGTGNEQSAIEPGVWLAGSSSVHADGQVLIAPLEAPPRRLQRMRVRLQMLNADTVGQLSMGIRMSKVDHDEGVDLLLVDVSGATTLLGPGRCRVDKDRFINFLKDKNLVCEAEIEDAPSTN